MAQASDQALGGRLRPLGAKDTVVSSPGMTRGDAAWGAVTSISGMA